MILDLPTLTTSIDIRLARLRRIYYDDPKAAVTYRRVRDILRGHVDKAYHHYYQDLLSAERAIYQTTRKLHIGTRADDLFYQVQRLGEKIARLVEELQDLDQIATLYTDPNTPEAQSVARARQSLQQRIEDALQVQKSIPARLLAFGTSTAGRGMDRMQERIERLALRLDDIAATYDEIDDITDAAAKGQFGDLEWDDAND
jgi:hypothetical protein